MKKKELAKNLKLALKQLQEYSENDLIIAEGETRSIEEILAELKLMKFDKKKGNSPQMLLPAEKKVIFKVDYNDVDNLVTSTYGNSFEFVAYQEANNGSSYEFSVPNKYCDKDDVEEVKKGKYPMWAVNAVFQALYEDGHIEAGAYIVKVSW